MSLPKAFVAESAYKKSLSLLNLDKDDDSLEGEEYTIKTKTKKSGTAKNDEFKLKLAALTAPGSLSLDGGKGHDELSFDSKMARKIVLGKGSQVKSLSVKQDGSMQEVKDASFAGFEKYEFGGSGSVTLTAATGRTIAKGTLLEVDTGSGRDSVTFGKVTINGGTGENIVTGLEIETGSGNDTIALGDVSIGNNGYVSIDAGSGADTMTIGKISAPNGIVLLDGDTGKDVYNIKAGSTAKIVIEEEGSSADTVNISGAVRSRFSTAEKASKNLSFSLKTAKDDGETKYCLTVRGIAAAENEGAGGSFSIIAKNFTGDTLNILTSQNKLIANIALKDVADQVKADGEFHKVKLTLAAAPGKIKIGDAKANNLSGTSLSDIFYGGKGSDTIKGVNGRDVAVYDRHNWGKDTIAATKGTMTLVLAGITKSQVTRSLSGDTMTITRKGTSQQITVRGWSADTHKIVYNAKLPDFTAYVKAASPTAEQKQAARNEVWQKAGLASA